MSADNGIWVAEIDGQWWVYYGFASEPLTRTLMTEQGTAHPSQEAALLAAHKMAEDYHVLEYGVSVIDLPPDPLALADHLAAAVAALIAAGNVSVNQIVCMGGDTTCQPCEGRETLALSLAASSAALAAYQAARGTAYPAPSTESGFHEP